MSATAAATRAHLLEFARHRTTTVMLLALPPTVILVYGAALASFPGLPFLQGEPGTAGRVIGAAFATAFLAGLVGLFQAIGARGSDGRLEAAGFPRMALLVSRMATTVVIAGVAAMVSLTVVALGTDVAAPGWALLALLTAGLIYGLVGALVGQLLPRDLEGSLVLVFLADIDTALSSGFFETGTGLASWFPLSHPIAAFQAAVYDGTLATGDLLAAGSYAVLVAAVLTAVRLLGGVRS